MRNDIYCRDTDGNTPLHLAASNGYTQTMKAILAFHGHFIDSPNRLGVSHVTVLLGSSTGKVMWLEFAVSAEFAVCIICMFPYVSV